MSPRLRSCVGWVFVIAGWLGLGYLGCLAVTHETRDRFWTPIFRATDPCPSCEHVYRGWPLVWSEYQRFQDHRLLRQGNDWLPQSGPVLIEFKGRNSIVPTLWFLIAATLPPSIVGMFLRRVPAGTHSDMTPVVRACRVVLCISVLGLGATALELDTEPHHSFHVTGTEFHTESWFREHAPVRMLDETINSFRPKTVSGTALDGTPIYEPLDPVISRSTVYQHAHARAHLWRIRFTGEFEAVLKEEWEPAEAGWENRPNWSLTGAGLGLLLGCLLFRPWRGWSAPRVPHGADSASGPSA